MKPLTLTISYLVGFFILPVILPWMAAFMPWALFIILVLGLIALSLGSNWQHYAASIDDSLDFGPASADTESSIVSNDPYGQRSDKRDTTNSGGGVTSRRPLHNAIHAKH